MTMRFGGCGAAVFIILSLIGASACWGQTWTGGGADDNWNTLGNWDTGMPLTGADIVLAGTTRLTPVVTGTAYEYKSLNFGLTAGSFTLSGLPFSINSGGISNSSFLPQTINNDLILAYSQYWWASAGDLVFGGTISLPAGNSYTLNVNNLASVIINGQFAAPRISIIKSRAGDMVFAGSQASTFSSLSVNDGTVVLRNPLNTPVLGGTGYLRIGDSSSNGIVGTVRLEADQQIADSVKVEVNANGVLDLNGHSQELGDLTLNGGGVVTGGPITLKKTIGFSAAYPYPAAYLRSNVNLNGQIKSFSTTSSQMVAELSGVISNGGISIASGSFRFLGANTYTGGTYLGSGEILVGNDSALGTGDVWINTSGGKLSAYGAARTITNLIRVYGPLAFGGTPNLNVAGGMTIWNNTTLTVDSNTTTLSSPMVETGMPRAITKAGAGTLVLATGNSVSGGWTFSGGILAIAADGALGAGPLKFAGGSIRADGTARTFDQTVTATGDIGFAGTNDITLTGPLTLAGTTTIRVNNNQAILQGEIGQDATPRSLTKDGAGTLVLGGTGPSTYTGSTTVTGGTLVLAKPAGVLAIPGPLTVGDGGTGTDAVRLMADNPFSPGTTVTLMPSGVLDLAGHSTEVAGLDLRGGSIVTGGGILTVKGGMTTNSSGAVLSVPINLGGASRDVSVPGSGPLRVDGVLSNGGINLLGAGEVILTSANTFSGGIVQSSGTLTLGSDQSAGTGPLVVNGTLKSVSGTRTLSNPLTISSVLTAASDFTFSGNVTLSGATRIIANASVMIASPVGEGSPGASLSKEGSGTLVLRGAGLYTGGLSLVQGITVIGHDQAAGSGVLRLSGGEIRGEGQSRTVGNAVQIDANTTVGGTTDLTLTGAVTVTGARTLTVNNTGATTLAGNILQDAQGRSLTTQGPGTLILGGSVNLTGGLTIAGGTAILTSSGASLSPLTVASGALGIGADQPNAAMITLAGGQIRAESAARTVANPTTLSGNVSVGGSQNLVLSGVMTVTGNRTLNIVNPLTTVTGDIVQDITGRGITKTGEGTLVLAGSVSLSGGLAVSAGTLRLQGQVLSPVTVNGGALVIATDQTGTGMLTLSTGSIRAEGAARSVANPMTVAGPIVVGGAQDITFSGLTTLSGNRSIDVDNTAVTTISGGIGQDVPGRSLTKTGAGTLILAGTSSFTGPLVCSAGTLVVTAPNTFPGGVTIAGGALAIAHDQAIGSATLTLTAGSVLPQNSPRNISNPVLLNGNDLAIQGTQELTFSGPITLAAGMHVVSFDSTANTIISGPIGQDAAGRAFIKAGGGKLIISGTSANTYTGDTTVQSGLLVLAKTGVPAMGGNLVVGDGVGGPAADVVQLGASDQIPAAAGVTINASGNLDLNGYSNAIGTLSMNGGSASTGTGLLTVSQSITTGSSSPTSSISGRLNLSPTQTTAAVPDGISSIDLDIPATIQEGALRKTGSGTLRLSAANTFSGGLTVAVGTVLLAHDQAAGPGTLRLEGGTIVAEGGPRTLTNAIVVATSSTISGPENLTLTGPISGSSPFNKSGTGTLILPANTALSSFLNVLEGSLTAPGVSISTGFGVTLAGNSFNCPGLVVSSGALLTQSAGALTGGVTNRGVYSLKGGSVSGQVLNLGTLSITGTPSLGDLVNQASASLGSGALLTVDGSGILNAGTLTLSGGTISSSGPITNNNSLSGYGWITGAGALTNNGLLKSGGYLVLASAGGMINNGNVELAAGQGLEIAASAMANNGTVNLGGGTLSGSGTINNTAGGSIVGRGAITAPMAANAGSIMVSGGAMNISSAFINTGLIQLADTSGQLLGGAITNQGTILGQGKLASPISNAGSIESSGGTLTLSGSASNTATGLIYVPADSRVLALAGLPSNAGIINLAGGTFDNGGKPMTNTGQISGYGLLRTGGLTNQGSIILVGGASTVQGNVTNAAGASVLVPVLVGSWSEEAERKILATLDPVGAMAQGDPAAFAALVEPITAESLWVRDLLHNTQASLDAAGEEEPEPTVEASAVRVSWKASASRS